MAFGLGRLRLAPEHFWSMTPRELSSAMSAYAIAKGAAPSRAAVEELMSRFPDEAQEFSRWKRK